MRANFETAAKAREKGLLQCQIAAKRIDGGDAQLGREVEEIPTKRLGTGERAARENPHGKRIGIGIRRTGDRSFFKL